MLDINQNYSGPTSTANSFNEGRLKVDVSLKKSIIKKIKKLAWQKQKKV